MADAGYFRGTSAEQDNRFSDKEKKLLKQMRFADSIATKVEMSKVHLESLKPWISHRISELLGMEDDVLQEFVFNQLEADKFPDGRRIQINLTGFLNGKNARIFTGELWDMLIAAQESPSGIPPSLVTAKKEELRLRTEEQERLNETLKRTVSRFQDKLKNESPPPNNRSARSRSPSSPSRSNKHVSKSNDATEKSDSRRKDESQSQNRRQYRPRRSASASPPPRERSRSRSRDRDARKRDTNVTRSDRNTERRDKNRRSRSRSPRQRRHSPTWSRQTQQRRDYVQSTMDRSSQSHRKSKADYSDTVDRPKPRSRSRSVCSPQPTKELSEIEPELVTTTDAPSVEPDASPARSSDSGSIRGRKRGSPISADDGSPDQSKKNKKKSKKHKKHKKHKKSKDEEKGSVTIAPADDLERALREKALESMKRAYEKSVQNN